jgi:two-component system, cell cycle sensor histidine kinase and response regulator CckA
MNLVRGTETLLVVDDDQAILDTTAMMLSALGYNVLRASSGREALKKLQENSTSVDLLMTDLSMPDLNGEEVITEARKLGFAGPSVIISGYLLEKKDLPDTITGILIKPYRIDDLARNVRSFLDNSHGDS